jgi:hypothetical protein
MKSIKINGEEVALAGHRDAITSELLPSIFQLLLANSPDQNSSSSPSAILAPNI